MLADALAWVCRICGHVRGGGVMPFWAATFNQILLPTPLIRIDLSLTDYFIYVNICLSKFHLVTFIGSLMGYII